MNYGQKIAELRKSNKLTQTELGEKLNITAQAISKWENNLSEPDIDSIRRMCEIFEVSVDEFLGIKPKTDKTETSPESKENASSPRIINGYCEKCNKPVGPGEYKVTNFTYNTSALVNKVSPTKEQHIYCNACHSTIVSEKQRQDNILATAKANEKQRLAKKKLKKGLILGCIFLVVCAVIGFATYASMPSTGLLVGAIVLTIAGFTVPSQACWNGIVEDIFLFFCRSFRAPFGLIFELSLDGILWLLTVKLCLWILCGLLSVLWFTVGLVVLSVVSVFTFPYSITKACKGKFDN
jgi:transcriptional regulator with XRE-family HTH domain